MITEFATVVETCTATIHLSVSPGAEAFVGPLHIGIYPGGDEVWIEQEGRRVQIPHAHMAAFMAQIKRAYKISKESHD